VAERRTSLEAGAEDFSRFLMMTRKTNASRALAHNWFGLGSRSDPADRVLTKDAAGRSGYRLFVYIDHQRVAFIMADRFAIPRWFRICGVRATDVAVEGFQLLVQIAKRRCQRKRRFGATDGPSGSCHRPGIRRTGSLALDAFAPSLPNHPAIIQSAGITIHHFTQTLFRQHRPQAVFVTIHSTCLSALGIMPPLH
jgi:hypothetical protein